MLEKSCGWWLIWYLLFFFHGGAEGQLQWVVKEKVAAYGQNLILFCPVENCCSEPAGWSVGTKSIILDVNTFSNDPKGKYHETYNKDGFGVVIRNLSEADLNVTYYCVYGFDLSTPKYLLHGDVFKESTDEEMEDLYNTDNQTENAQDVPDKEKENDTTAIIIVVAIVVIMVGFIIGMTCCVYRSRIKKERQREIGTKEEMEDLNPSDIQEQEPKNIKTMEALNEGQTPLHIAAKGGRTEVVDFLLKSGASTSVVNKKGHTPLHLAAKGGRTEVVDFLLKSGASPSVVNKKGQTPLHLAAKGGRTEVVDLLLKSGASPSVVNQEGRTALQIAAKWNRTEVVDLLSKSGASPSVVNKQGMTPLHHAAWNGQTDVTKVIVEAGASLSAVDNEGNTPYDIAHYSVKELLQEVPHESLKQHS